MAENEERLMPFEAETPKILEKERFQAISDYTRQLTKAENLKQIIDIIIETV